MGFPESVLLRSTKNLGFGRFRWAKIDPRGAPSEKYREQKVFFFFGFDLFSYPTPPFSTLGHPGNRQISIRSKSDKKKSGKQLQPKNAQRQKKIYRLNRVPWGSWGPPMVGFPCKKFCSLFGRIYLRPTKFPDKRFLTKCRAGGSSSFWECWEKKGRAPTPS